MLSIIDFPICTIYSNNSTSNYRNHLCLFLNSAIFFKNFVHVLSKAHLATNPLTSFSFLYFYFCFHNPISIFLSLFPVLSSMFLYKIPVLDPVDNRSYPQWVHFLFMLFRCLLLSSIFFFLSSLVSSLFRIFVSRISCIFQFRINLSMRNIKMIIIIIFITLILLLKYIYFVKERIIFFILFPEYEYVILIYFNFWII